MNCNNLMKKFSLLIKSDNEKKNDVIVNSEDPLVHSYFLEKECNSKKKINNFINEYKTEIIFCINKIIDSKLGT